MGEKHFGIAVVSPTYHSVFLILKYFVLKIYQMNIE